LGERRYSSYSYSTSALDGGEWSASRPGRAWAPGKGPPVPTVQEAGWTPEPVWTQRLQEKSFCLCRRSNLDRQVVQPVVRHYTDWATQLTTLFLYILKIPSFKSINTTGKHSYHWPWYSFTSVTNLRYINSVAAALRSH
jgi:hypothetical protein